MKRRGILGTFLVSSALLISGINFSFAKDSVTNEEVIASSEPGNVFYAADFATDIKNEPKYSEQKTKTFDSMSFNYTPQVYRGNSVKVAVIDSGINYNHEDFGTIQGVSRTLEYNYTNEKWDEYTYSSNPTKINDTLGHGTNVASVIASQINGKGVAGIAPNVELYIYKVTNSSNGYEWGAIQTAINDCITRKIDVINMSFQAYEYDVSYNGSSMGAVSGCSTILSSWLNRAYNAGITLVGAAGNYNTDKLSYPASNNHVISVGSLARGSTSEKAGFSNTSGIDLVAPGYVTTAEKGSTNAYKETQGTSFSAPIVTAAIALYKQKNPSATPAEIESALYASCDPIEGNPSWAGNGRLNIDKLLGLNENSPQSFNISNVDDTLELEVGDEFQLDYSILPSSFDEGIEYTTAIGDCVSVSDTGLITALAEGEDFLSIYPKGYPTLCEEFNIVVNSKQSYDSMPESPIELSTVDLLTAPSGDNWTTNNLSTYCGSATANKNGSFSVTYSLATDFADLDFSRIESSTLTVIVGGGSNSGTGGITVSLSNNSSSTQNFPSNSNATSLKNTGNYRKTFTFTNETAFNSITISAPAKYYLIDFSYKFEFTVKGSGTTTPTVSSVSIANPTGSNQLTVGNTLSLSATVTGTNNPSQTVTWSSSNTSYATVSDSGLVTAIAAGNVTITATSTVNTSKTGTLDLTIVAAAVTNYTVTFNSNGGTGSMTDEQTTGSTYVTPTCGYTKDGYTFDKWALNSISGAKYSVGQTISNISNNITLYATWTKESSSTDDFNGYYDGIYDSYTGSTLRSKLNELNTEKRKSTPGYDGMRDKFALTDLDPNGSGKILGFYDNELVGPSWDSGATWNREHVWPKSLGGNKVEGDMHMVRPAKVSSNGDRGNDYYAKTVYDPGSLGYENYRGIAARIIFYCAIADTSLNIIDATSGGSLQMGKLSDLLEWNLTYQPSTAQDAAVELKSEQYRNNKIASSTMQGNRNPFIDHPEYACKIWGDTNSTTQKICSSQPVTNKKVVSLTVTGEPTKTSYYHGDKFSANGLEITATYDDNTTADITSLVKWSPSPLTKGTTSVTGTYSCGGVEKNFTIDGLTVESSSTGNLSMVTNLSDLQDGDLVYLAMGINDGDLGVTGQNNKDATVSDSKAEWVKYVVVKSGTTYKLMDGTNYIASVTTNSFIYGTEGGSITLDSSSNVKIGSRWFAQNGTNYRCYSPLGSYKPFHLYKIENSQIESVTLNKSSLEFDLYNNSTPVTLQATVTGESSAAKTVSWSSGSSSVATVDSTGKVTPVGVGETTITATSTVDENKKATCTVSVTDSTPKLVTSITVNNAPSSIEQNGYKDIDITVGPSNATDKSVTWNSSSSAIAISNSSNTGARLTANGSVGAKATITITANDGSGVSTSFEVTIAEKIVLVGITYSGKTTYAVGSSMSNNDGHLVYAQYSDGTEINVTSSATITGFDSSEEKLNKITVSYTEDNVTKTTTQQLLILEDVNSGDGESYYEKVTSTSDLTDGKYLIVYEGGNVAFNGALTTLDAASNTVSVNISNNQIKASDTIDNAAFTYDSEKGSFLGSGGKYFGNASDSNALTSSNTALKNTVSISENNVVIKSAGGSYLRYNTGSDQMRFRYYKSSSYTGQKPIQIYKYVQGQSSLSAEQKAKIYSASFLEAFTCDGSGVKAPTFASDITWTSLSTEYSKLDAATKALLKNATYTLSGSEVDATGETNIVIAYAVARYDFVVSKYNWEDFMERGVSSSRRTPVISISNMDTSTIIIASIAAAGIAAIGGYFFYKKRKEQ